MPSSASELAEPIAPPAPQPGSPPRHTPKLPPARVWKIFGIVSAIVAVACLLAAVFHKKTVSESALTLSAAPASGVSLRLRGSTEAIRARSILAPILSGQQVGTLTITRLRSAGARVKAGDVLVEFDRQAQVRDALEKQAEYNKLVDQVAQEQAKESAARAKDETELHQAQSDWNKAQLEMHKAEILSKIDLEKAQETLEESQATLQQLRETFELKRKAARAGIRILEIQRDRTQQTMRHAQSNAELMRVRSPIDGVVVLNTTWREGRMGEVQEGDQVRPGVPFVQVVDPSKMRVVAQVNQEDFLALRIGQRVKVRLDAYPELVFEGSLEEISPIARNGNFSGKLRAFTAIFSIEGSDPKLMPDLSAAVDLVPGR